MNRRQLFTALAAAALAPSELWVPKRSYFLSPRGGWPSAEGGYLVPPHVAAKVWAAVQHDFTVYMDDSVLWFREGNEYVRLDQVLEVDDVVQIEYDGDRVLYKVNGATVRHKTLKALT